ncbi:MAG TPA: hypothetical protein VFT45_12315 [Longimicrobium sp.]|nr:hypothetical protein [Longimicrobium sp.]
MLQNVEEAQQLSETAADSPETLNEILARAGVSIPTLQNVAPFQAERLRPRWLAFLIRVFAPRS